MSRVLLARTLLGRVLLVMVAIGGLGMGSVLLQAAQEDPFPHADHQGLFPLCTGCHEGIPNGQEADWYPEPASCNGCHDGVERAVVAWNGPTGRPSNVAYDHVVHASELEAADDSTLACASCHNEPGGERMQVAEGIPVDGCWSCHEEGGGHYDTETTCETCHVPLAETDLSRARIEALPMPPSHETAGFLPVDHGDLVSGRSDRCAVCHTQDRCVSCHVDVDRVEIAAVPPAPGGMNLPEHEARYPEPPSHVDEGWLDAHQIQAAARDCSTCHTTDDCRSCHVASVPDVVAALPARDDVVAPGVGLTSRPPESHGSMFFVQAHPVLAAADEKQCATCHVPDFCVSCHDAEPEGGYHPSNFVARHAADSWGQSSECVNCHSQQRFCRECHVEVGLTATGRLGAGYHDAMPLWLLQHGQAARQSLESCASCHKQNDCVQCHGELGAFKVNPHSRDFDAERAWLRSPRTCLACHLGNPLNRGGSPCSGYQATDGCCSARRRSSSRRS